MTTSRGRFGRSALALWIALGALSFAFTQTRGLAFVDGDAPGGLTYVSALESAGGDDGIAIAMGMFFACLGVVWGLMRVRRPFGRGDLLVNGGLVALQGLYLATIEQGSIAATIARDRNLVLAAWVACLLALSASVIAGARRDVAGWGSTSGERLSRPGSAKP
jgi:hypothetical protein